MERRFGMLCQSRGAHVITKLAFHHSRAQQLRCFQQLCSLVVMAKAVTHKFVISMVEDFLRLDWPLIDHSGIVWIIDQRKFIGFAIIWTRII